MFKFAAIPSISHLSTTYLRCSVTATENGVRVDPTGSTIQFAFLLTEDDPVAGDWVNGSWETAGEIYYARCLVGSGGDIDLAEGTYKVWVKLVIGVETLVRPVGELLIH